MKLSDLKKINENTSPILVIANELESELKNSDEGKQAKIKLSHTPASTEITVKDWGDVQDTGAADYDEHAQHLSNERAIHGIVNKYSVTHSKVNFTVKYFDEGNYFHIDIKQKITEGAEDKAPLDYAADAVISAFKNSSHGKGFDTSDFKTKSIKDGKVISAFDWGHWRENEHGSEMSVSGKTESDVKDILKKLQADFDKKFKKAISIEADLEDQSLVITLKQERPVTDFI